MNNIERFFNESKDIKKYANSYFKYLSGLLDRIDPEALSRFVKELDDAYEQDRTIFIVGNGGSAATASHMANDIGVDVLKKSGCRKAFRAMALTDNASVMTAIANDDGYNNLFVNQLRIHYRAGDKILAISASGNSPNATEAVEWVKARNGRTMCFTGFDGGKLARICDVVINVETPKGEYGPVEDVHMILDHLVGTWLQFKMAKESK